MGTSFIRIPAFVTSIALALVLFLSTMLPAAMASDASIQAASSTTTAAAKVMPLLPVLADAKHQELFSIAKNVPGVKAWSADGWQYLGSDFIGTADGQWTSARVQLKLPSSAPAPQSCANGWFAMVQINLQTMKVENADYPSTSNAVCEGLTFGGPVTITPTSTNTAVNFIIPPALATITRDGIAAAKDDDVSAWFAPSFYGEEAELRAPTISSSIYSHMDHSVQFLLNAVFNTGGSSGTLTQIGWTATSTAGCSGCGISANTVDLVFVDESVWGNDDPHASGLAYDTGTARDLFSEVICQNNGNYGLETLYNGNEWGHLTTIPCTVPMLKDPWNNSVFFENANTSSIPSSGWSPYITSPVYAYSAYHASGSTLNFVQWGSSTNRDATACTDYASTVITTGNMASGGTADWDSLSHMQPVTTC
jgi:hypothetical protein